MYLGIDFGTTNSVAAIRQGAEGVPTLLLVEDPIQGGWTANYRSVIYFPSDTFAENPVPITGPRAMRAYLEDDARGRLFLSLKSFLASSFESTRVGKRTYSLEQLIALIVKDLVGEIQNYHKVVLDRAEVVVGRPVHFVHARDREDDLRAEARIRKAFELAGLSQIRFALEPVAAAISYARRTTEESIVLVGDFGGGTSDFSLVRIRGRGDVRENEILGNAGIGFAGDAFDAALLKAKVLEHFGYRSRYRGTNGVELDVPHWFYEQVSSWHKLSVLRDPKNLKLLYDISLLSGAAVAQSLQWMVQLLEDNLAFALYRQVDQCKRILSSEQISPFTFYHKPIDIHEDVSRDEFDAAIQERLQQFETCVSELLHCAQLPPSQVDKVFLTGGTAFVPAVRAQFSNLFGAEKIASGEEFTSVASGLALA